MESDTNNYINRDYINMLENNGVFILKPELNSDKTSIICVDTNNNKIEYYRRKKEKYTKISIINKMYNHVLINIEIYDDSKIVREYQGDNNEVILELVTTRG